MDKAELLKMDRRAKNRCESESNLSYVGPFQYKVTIRRKGFSTACQTFDDVDLAIDFRNDKKSEMRRGKFVDTREVARTTLETLIDRYSNEITPTKKSHIKEKSKLNVIKRHPICQEYVGVVSGNHIATYRDNRLKEVGTKTVRDELNLLGHIFKVAIQEWGMPLPANPVDHVRKPATSKARDRRLEHGEEARLMRACQAYGGMMPAIVIIAIQTGMRRGEIASLTWSNINLTKKTLHLSDTKNGESRDVPLSSIAIASLKELPHRIDGSVFGMTSDSIGRAFRRITSRTKDTSDQLDPLLDLRFHDLRHEATSRFFELGLNPMQVAAITGHKTLQMLKRYTHLKAEDLAELLG